MLVNIKSIIEEELKRVIVHGLFQPGIGYDDKNNNLKSINERKRRLLFEITWKLVLLIYE